MPERKKNPYRDENGVRLQKYRRFEAGRDYNEIDAARTHALCDMFRRGFFGIEDTPDGQQVQRKPGRPRKLESVAEFTEVVDKYLNYIESKAADGVRLVPDIEGFCCFAGISRETLNEWERTRPADYSDAIKALKNAIAAYKKQLALSGDIPALVFATDFNNNHGYIQQTKTDINIGRKVDIIPDRAEIMRKLPPVLPDEDGENP